MGRDENERGREGAKKRELAFYSLGFLRPKLRKLLSEMGYDLHAFAARRCGAVAVWGRKPVSARGIKAARQADANVVTFEDWLIRSIKPGWGESPRALSVDHSGVYFDTQHGSDLARLLLADKADADALAEAEAMMDLQVKLGVSKYNRVPRGAWVKKGYVLVVDQVKGDQSVAYGQADAADFAKALAFAKTHYPDADILIRAHPAGGGYYDEGDLDERISFCDADVNPFDLIDGALAVVTVTSQMGWDAILAGKTPHVFGAPFYAGLGLSDDHKAETRGDVERVDAYYKAMLDYGHYFAQDGSPSDALTEIFALHDEMQQRALAHQPLDLKDMRAWKRPHMKRFFPNQNGTQVLRWGERKHADEWVVEDGFLRSQGLGAKLVPPLSLIVDKTGIYFDPSQPSDLEGFIHARRDMLPLETARAKNLQKLILHHQVSKYNLPRAPIALPKGKSVLLVVGQVEDDRSIILGATGNVKTNAELLQAARKDYPDHYLVYKPHPDVLAGLRKGEISAEGADAIYEGGDITALWEHVDALATITSLSGFEALLHGKEVSCYGMPFYAGWGLTKDYAPATGRRSEAELEALIYASLIDYPLYLDPKTQRLSTAEMIVKRIANDETRYPHYLRATTWAQQKYERLKG